MKLLKYIVFFLHISLFAQLPKDFVYLSDIDSTIQKELRYFTNNNFIGKQIDGYKKSRIIISKKAAEALAKVQQELKSMNLSLKVFDAYRPQRAVNHFVRWAKVSNDTLMKQQYYPDIPKKDLFKLGYIAEKSGHTRGSTVDLTVVDITSNQELDMGSTYDFFGDISHPFYQKITKEQKSNRMLLRKLMITYGFKPYAQEWWHFTLSGEPFPNQYFNFEIK